LRSHVVQTFPSGAAAANGSTIRIGHALDTAQRDAIGFHHRGQHLLAGVDAQAQERMAHVAQYTLHGHRELNLRGRYGPQRGLRVRLHPGGSFGCLSGSRMLAHAGRRSRHLGSRGQQIAGHRQATLPEDYDLRASSDRFGVDIQRVVEAVRSVGDEAASVGRYLNRKFG
jgi:hypothetical protein